MNKIRLVLSVLSFVVIQLSGFAAWDIYKSGISINGAYYDCQLNTAAPDYQHNYFGRYTTGGNLILNFAEVYTFRNGGDNVCGASLYYRIYRTCDAPPAFTQLNLPFNCEFFNNPIPCGPDINNTGDQKWQGTPLPAVNFISGLTQPGTYYIEVYFDARGHSSGGNCGASTTKFSSNGGTNFWGYFEYHTATLFDAFSDNNSNLDPVWSGASEFQVVTNSDVSGLLGSEFPRTSTLRSNASTSGTFSLSTPNSNWQSQQEWYFWVGRRNIAASATNASRIWLYCNNSSLNPVLAGTNGYYIQIGGVGNDPIVLNRVTNGVVSAIFTSSSTIEGSQTDYGVAFYISRSETGLWTIRTSSLPQNSTQSQATPTARSCPEAAATVVHGTVLDNSHIPGGSGFIGFSALVTSGFGQSQEFDNLRFRALPPNTTFSFNTTTSAVTEPASDVTVAFPINLTSPDGVVGASVQVALISGPASRLDSYSVQTVSWLANEGGTKNAVFTVDANSICDDIATLTFQLQNPTGGFNAQLGTNTTHVLTITDDDTGYATIVNDDFEDGNSTGWTSFGAGSWPASNAAPCSGTWSMRHTNTGVAGNSHVTFDADNAVLTGVETTWRFNVKHFNRAPSPNNRFLVFLAANETNLFGTTVDGYAIGVNPLISGDPDSIRLYRIDNGVANIIRTTSINLNNTFNEIGFEVVRSAAGVWTIRIDSNGDFDNLVSVGSSVTDNTYQTLSFFGLRFNYSAANSDRLSMDDVLVTQKGCREEFYSQSPGGNFNAAIWAPLPVGTPQTVNPSRFTRFVVQSGAPVTLNVDAACESISINNGATFSGGTNTLSVYRNWVTDATGVFNAGTSNVVFRGDIAQNILGTGEPTFFNLGIDNNGFNVNLLDTVRVRGVVSLNEGTLQTQGRLILTSDATNTGSIGPIQTGADINGNVTVQRFIPSASAGYIYLGAPTVASPQTIEAIFDDDFVTTGVPGSDFPPPYSFVSIYTYNETLPGGRNTGWVPMTNTSNLVDPTRGYSLYVQSGAQMFDVTGTIQKGNLTNNLSFTNTGNSGDGWNLLTNMYPSEIDWITLESNSSDINNYFIYDTQLPGYRSFSSNLGVGSAPRYIASSQGFFVKTTAINQTLNYTESVKSNNNTPFERSIDEASFVRLAITRNGQGDEAVIAFDANATNAYDVNLDAEKLESPVASAPELALVSSDNLLLTIDGRPIPDATLEIPVYLDLPAAGDYTITFPEMQNVPLGSCLTIEDLVTNEIYTIGTDLTITISTTASYQGNRMIVRVSPVITVISSNADCFGQSNGAIQLQSVEGSWSLSILNEFGGEIYSGDGSTEIAVPSGTYLIELNNLDDACSSVQETVSITEPGAPSTQITYLIDECNQGNSGSIALALSNIGSYTWELTGTNGFSQSGSGEEDILYIENLAGDVYYLNVTDQCGTYSSEAILLDENAVDAEWAVAPSDITFTENTTGVISAEVNGTNATNILWYVNGNLASIGNILSYEITQPGIYGVSAVVTNGACEVTLSGQISATVVVGLTDEEKASIQWLQTEEGVLINFNEEMNISGLRVTDVSGRVVYEKNNLGRSGQQLSVPMNAWASGIYQFSLLKEGAKVEVRSFMK